MFSRRGPDQRADPAKEGLACQQVEQENRKLGMSATDGDEGRSEVGGHDESNGYDREDVITAISDA